MFRSLFLTVLFLLISGCSAIDVSIYKNTTPAFDFFQYFQGTTKGWGIVQNRKGVITRQFVVDITGTTDENGQLILQEYFLWNDGEQSTRTWRVLRSDKHNFTGTADDVVGVARGSAYGSVLNWQYHLNVETEGSIWKIHFDDWLYLQPDNVVLNKATMSKFGIEVGQITITFYKT